MSESLSEGGFGELIVQMERLQSQLATAEAEVEATQIEGTAGGGAVRITVSGDFSFDSVAIEPSVVNANEIALLEDLVLAALRDATSRLIARRREAMGSAVSDALGGLFGAAGGDEDARRLWRASHLGKERTLALFDGPIQDLVDELGRLPGVGPKSAQRIAFHLLKVAKEDALRLASAIVEVKEQTVLCSVCFNVGIAERCSICSDTRRDASTVCVVEDPRDIVAVERTREFHGRYHVLGGALNPIEGVGPEQLHVRELLSRLDTDGVVEVILCTNPNLEGDTTAMYLARLLKPLGVHVTRIASGLPVGGDLEYADELTLGRALEGRRDLEG